MKTKEKTLTNELSNAFSEMFKDELLKHPELIPEVLTTLKSIIESIESIQKKDKLHMIDLSRLVLTQDARDLFTKESIEKAFDITPNVALIGVREEFLFSKFANKGFYLSTDFNWHLIPEGKGVILVPTYKLNHTYSRRP